MYGIVMMLAALALPGDLSVGDSVRSPSPERPGNVILIGWDGAQRAHVHECLARNELPHLEALAAAGTMVDIFIEGTTDTKAGWTQILTGKTADVTGVHSNFHYRPIPKGMTIFERLKDHFGGDRFICVAVIGKKAHCGPTGEPRKIRLRNSELARVKKLLELPPDRRRVHRDEDDDQRRGNSQGSIRERRITPPGGSYIVEEGGHSFLVKPGQPYMCTHEACDVWEYGLLEDDKVGQRAITLLERYKNKPFFFFIHFGEIDHDGHSHGENSAAYNNALISADRWTGAIIAKLKELGLYDETLVYVTADHGFDEGRRSHHNAPHVFLATNDTKVLRGGTGLDIAPTILQRFGLDVSKMELATPLTSSKSLSHENEKAVKPEAKVPGKGLGVRGRYLMKDGKTWIPRGVGLGAFTPAPWYTNPQPNARRGFPGAAAQFGPRILNAAKQWHVDSVRFLVSQPGLDPQSNLHTEKYVKDLVDGINLCLDLGFVVTIAMQDQTHSGETDTKPLPTAHTMRAWDVIGPHFANHPYVMLELFNESGPVARGRPRLNRKLWMDGGAYTDDNGKKREYIGHQTIINEFRRRGWTNVLVVDMLPWARRIDRELLGVEDPLNRLCFAVHPYFQQGGDTREKWDAGFGDISKNHVVLVNEWFCNSKAPFSVKTYDLPRICDEFLAYLREKQLPLWAFGFDIPSTIVRDFRGTPNDWSRFGPNQVKLGRAGAGCGTQIREHFRMLAEEEARNALPRDPG